MAAQENCFRETRPSVLLIFWGQRGSVIKLAIAACSSSYELVILRLENHMKKRLLIVATSLVLMSACGDSNDDLVTIAISGPHTVAPGATISLSAQTTGASDTSYEWSISSSTVATIDANGVVTGVGAGEAMVTATGSSSGVSASHVVVVGETAVIISGTTVVQTGSTAQLTATTVNGSDSAYTWSSSDPAIASVDSNGLVTGVADGEVTITATGDSTGADGSASITATADVPNYTAWAASGHADRTADAFRHWDEDDPAEIPTSCARCHSATGFKDYIGEDGSAVGTVDTAAAVGTVVDCKTCHNTKAEALTSVTFPSTVTVNDLGPEARCMTCHQGRSSTDTVDAAITNASVADDTVSPDLGFINIHYYAAGATIQAGKVRGGYQYSDKVYDWRFRHVPGKDTCVGCHDPHSLQVKVSECAGCHTGVTTVADLRSIRMLPSTAADYDGDGDTTEGMYHEVQGIKDLLLGGIKSYSTEQSLGAICYSGGSYPYWFQDTSADGNCDTDEVNYGNRFQSWTPRLLRAAYNYQVASKDPGGFAHNAKYLIQLVHDSISDLNSVLSTTVDISAAVRNDPGHFNGSSEAARHWDEDDTVSSSCSKCHSGSEGLRFYLQHGVGLKVPEQDNGLDCATCHEDLSTFTMINVDSVTYPSDVEISNPGSVSNLCGTCHSGRTGGADIDAAIAAGNMRFLNVHYLPASAVKAGAAAKVGYEYPSKTYSPDWDHQPGNDCTFCHDATQTKHSFSVADAFSKCTALCHTTAVSHEDIRGNPFFAGALHPLDYDGDGSNTERLKDELMPIAAALLAEMQSTATTNGAPICYTRSAYPYWFKDTNTNGVCDGAEGIYPNRYTAWTPALMKASHNYQISQVDGGAWAHNFDYTVQLLYDSIEDLGGAGAVSSFIRPAVPTP